MDVRVPVSVGDLIVIDLGQPVIGCYRAGIAQDQAAHRISHCGILLNSPVFHLHIAVDDLLVIQDRGFHVADLLSLLPVKDIGLGNVAVTRLDQHVLNAVLDILHRDPVVAYFILKIRRYAKPQQIDHIIAVILLFCVKCLMDRRRDLRHLEIGDLAVTFNYLKHLT